MAPSVSPLSWPLLLFGRRSSVTRQLIVLTHVGDDGVAYSLFGYALYDALIQSITKYPSIKRPRNRSIHPCAFLLFSVRFPRFKQNLSIPTSQSIIFLHITISNRSCSWSLLRWANVILHPVHTHKTCFVTPPLVSVLAQISLFSELHMRLSHPVLVFVLSCRPLTLPPRVYLYASSSDLSGLDAPASPGTDDTALLLSSIFFLLRSVLCRFF